MVDHSLLALSAAPSQGSILESIDIQFPSVIFQQAGESLDDLLDPVRQTRFWRLDSDDLQGLHLHAGDLLLVRRTNSLVPGKIGVVIVESEYIACLVETHGDGVRYVTVPEAGRRETLAETVIAGWGVVDHVIRNFSYTRK